MTIRGENQSIDVIVFLESYFRCKIDIKLILFTINERRPAFYSFIMGEYNYFCFSNCLLWLTLLVWFPKNHSVDKVSKLSSILKILIFQMCPLIGDDAPNNLHLSCFIDRIFLPLVYSLLHGLFSGFAGHSKRSWRTFYGFTEEPYKSTAKSSELCSPAFKGVRTDTGHQSSS